MARRVVFTPSEVTTIKRGGVVVKDGIRYEQQDYGLRDRKLDKDS